ncbi:hypothetical protein PUNSTDRAFT_130720 [Punctularia strigosozonata HHB-11173 SS5]|uniref:uncharacterized protein n=1 Tax=Punctularia strigosozonata (strain HHB-11173) TaxID=741275 RepID=UPI00044178B7|nr:uncharacterized protein PUNSTDRAFT_130720 [Punctularia strigosozonata HHB-11173 SS5]EIN12460.1 hypothetical protein PUNSTDRAFT_130720 [Punctularia strigosozonata HHB-11173 SS5]
MSSALYQIAELTGANYQHWASDMQNYLMAHSHWTAIVNPRPTLSATPSAQQLSDEKAWVDHDMQAMGCINLRLSMSIRSNTSDLTTAAAIWQRLKKDYGSLALGNVYHEFSALLATNIPGNSHPAPALNKMQAHWDRLKEVKVVSTSALATARSHTATASISAAGSTAIPATEPLPEWLLAMFIIAKLPPQMSFISHLQQQKQPAELDVDDIRRQVILAYDQRQLHASSSKKPNDTANKLSAVKRKQGDQSFSQQQRPNGQQQQKQQSSQSQQRPQGQQQHSDKRRRGRSGRGKGKDKGKGKAYVADCDHNVTMASVAVAADEPKPASRRAPSPYVADRRMFKPVVKVTEPSTIYPSVNGALKLARDLGIRPTPEQLRVLEATVEQRRIQTLNEERDALRAATLKHLLECPEEDTFENHLERKRRIEAVNRLKGTWHYAYCEAEPPCRTQADHNFCPAIEPFCTAETPCRTFAEHKKCPALGLSSVPATTRPAGATGASRSPSPGTSSDSSLRGVPPTPPFRGTSDSSDEECGTVSADWSLANGSPTFDSDEEALRAFKRVRLSPSSNKGSSDSSWTSSRPNLMDRISPRPTGTSSTPLAERISSRAPTPEYVPPDASDDECDDFVSIGSRNESPLGDDPGHAGPSRWSGMIVDDDEDVGRM